MQDLLSPDKTSSEILIHLLNSPVILHLDQSIIIFIIGIVIIISIW